MQKTKCKSYLIVSFIVAMLLSGCASNAPSTLFTNIIEDVVSGDTEYSHENALPDSFPGDVPIYPDVVIERSGIAEGMYSLVCYSDEADLLDEITAYYKEALADNGWEIEDVFNLVHEDGLSLTFIKDRRVVGVILYRNGRNGVTHLISVMEPSQ